MGACRDAWTRFGGYVDPTLKARPVIFRRLPYTASECQVSCHFLGILPSHVIEFAGLQIQPCLGPCDVNSGEVVIVWPVFEGTRSAGCQAFHCRGLMSKHSYMDIRNPQTFGSHTRILRA